MFELIEDILLSNVLILLVFSIMLFGVTVWAFRTNEYAGYALGWLVGLFCIIAYRALVGDPGGDAATEVGEVVDTTLNFFVIVFMSFLGLIIGLGLVFIMRYFSGSRIRNGLPIAVMTATLVVILFVLVTSGEETQQAMSIFGLAFGIGALSNYVVLGQFPSRRTTGPADYQSQDIPTAQADDSMRSNFDRLRRRNNQRRQ
jgi:hypothetical protein